MFDVRFWATLCFYQGRFNSSVLSFIVIWTKLINRPRPIHYTFSPKGWISCCEFPSMRSIVLSYSCVLQSILCANWLLNNLFCVFTTGLAEEDLVGSPWSLFVNGSTPVWRLALCPEPLRFGSSLINESAHSQLTSARGAVGKVWEVRLLITLPGCNQRLAASLRNYSARY